MAPGSYGFTVDGKAADGAHHSATGMLVVDAAPTGGGEGGGSGDGTGGNGSGSGNGTGGGSGNGSGGNGATGGAGDRSSGCSIGGGDARGALVGFGALVLLALLRPRRRLGHHPPTN